MIDAKFFYDAINEHGTDFFSGVPDLLLKSFCEYLADNAFSMRNIISVNEGGAVALAIGHYLATKKIPLVYMQNSGEGNAANPLISLCDPEVYSVPILLLIGWRGEPGIRDEMQFTKQGRITCSLLDAMKILVLRNLIAHTIIWKKNLHHLHSS